MFERVVHTFLRKIKITNNNYTLCIKGALIITGFIDIPEQNLGPYEKFRVCQLATRINYLTLLRLNLLDYVNLTLK